MKAVFVMAYPIYHDGLSADQWMDLHNQNRWIPGILSELGCEVEYWAGDHESSAHTSRMDDFPDYPVRFFETDAVDRRSKFHRSRAMEQEARTNPADVYFIKGVDGGIGVHLVRAVLAPLTIPYVAITGGAFYHPIVKGADAVLYESEFQRGKLVRGSWRRSRIPEERVIRMQKSVDLNVFAPAESPVRYDVVTACRLDLRNKSFSELGMLSSQCRVAIAGGGPDEELLQRRYPQIEWVGRIPNAELPAFYSSSRLFVHNGKGERKPTRDFYPRVLAEAMACGAVCLAFCDLVQPDVLPKECGRLVSRENIGEVVRELLSDESQRLALSQNARAYAEAHLGRRSAREPLEHALRLARSSV